MPGEKIKKYGETNRLRETLGWTQKADLEEGDGAPGKGAQSWKGADRGGLWATGEWL